MITVLARFIQATMLLVPLLAVLTIVTADTADAQEGVPETLRGTLRHGGSVEGFDPSSVTVSLNVLEGITSVEETSVQPDVSGAFEFDVTPREGRAYFVSVEYQGATYSDSRSAGNVTEPVTLEVFEAINDPAVLAFESYTIIVTGAVREEGFLEVMERAVVRNDSGMTLVPDLNATAPAMLGFLRFGLPNGYYNLDVGSSLTGGSVLDVPEGFAIDMPVPPTSDQPHQFEFVYRVPYEQATLDLSRTMRFGAASLYVVVPVDVARPGSSQLEDLGAADISGRLTRLLEGSNISPGQTLDLSVSQLPLPTFWNRFSRSAGDSYLRAVTPAAVALLAAALLYLGYRRRPIILGTPAAATVQDQRKFLAERLAVVEANYAADSIPQRRYQAEREELRRSLIDWEMRERLGLDEA